MRRMDVGEFVLVVKPNSTGTGPDGVQMSQLIDRMDEMTRVRAERSSLRTFPT